MTSRGYEVYKAIKALAMSYAFPPDKRILLRPLATQLNTNTHQVRDALLLLSGEGWVIQAPNKGFLAKRPDPATFAEYNSVNCLLLESALHIANSTGPVDAALAERFSSLRNSASKQEDDAASLAITIAQLFIAIAQLGDNDVITSFVSYCNEQLHYLRLQECQQHSAVPSEIARLCDLASGRQFAELRRAIVAYHDRQTLVTHN